MMLCGMMASLFCGTIATAVVVEVDVEMEFLSCAKEYVHSKKNTRSALI